jgi:hypothetical protein
MEQRLRRAEWYRQQANRCADLAKTTELDFLSEFLRRTAVRYVLMAEDLERAPEARTATSISKRADVFLRETSTARRCIR